MASFSARVIAVHALKNSFSPARTSFRRTASGMNSSVRCRSPSNTKRRSIRPLYVRPWGGYHHPVARGDAQRAQHRGVRADPEATDVDLHLGDGPLAVPPDGELTGQLAPVQTERPSHRVSGNFVGAKGDFREPVRFQHLASAGALDLLPLAPGQRARILPPAPYRGHHPQGGRVEPGAHRVAVRLDFEPPGAEL